MGERLDQAAILSARTVRAVAKTPIARRVGENLSLVRRMVAAAREAVELEAAAARPAVESAPTRPADPHPGLVPQPVEAFVPGDDERCSCRGTGDAWCGATRGDVVHDLMSHGMQLDRTRAEAIWRDAQDARAAAAL